MAIYWTKSEVDLENYTLILPSISVGNVGQLAVDLLITNLNAERIAHIHHSCFIPVVSADPFCLDNTQLTTTCQLYVCKEKKTAIIQNRSPIMQGRLLEYTEFIIKFIKEKRFQKIVMLSSAFSQFFTFEDLQGIPIHYLCSSYPEEALQKLNWKPFALPRNVNDLETSAIPGGGIAKFFFEKCKMENIPLVLLVLVCSEGDNYPEAFQMVDTVNSFLKLKEGTPCIWSKPISWNLPFGNKAPSSLY